jgi:hypothetical protein
MILFQAGALEPPGTSTHIGIGHASPGANPTSNSLASLLDNILANVRLLTNGLNRELTPGLDSN